MSFHFTKDIDEGLKNKHVEVKALADQLSQLGVKIEGIETQVSKTYDEISLLEVIKEKITKMFSLVREHLSMKVIEQQLEGFLVENVSFDKFIFLDLNVVEILGCALSSTHEME